MAPSEGTKSGSVPDDVGVALGEAVGLAVGVGVGDGESLGDGDAGALGVGVGLVADAAVHPGRTSTMPMAPTSRAMRKPMGVQRRRPPRRAPRIAASGVEKAA